MPSNHEHNSWPAGERPKTWHNNTNLMDPIETLLGLCIGAGLSAACGFRVFVPMLVISLAAKAGHLHLASGFEWLGSDMAVLTFFAATVLEVLAYYVPWVDNLMDSIATPAAVIAGTVVTASMVSDVSPLLQWTLAAIVGGGTAAVVQGATVVARGASSLMTGGLANPVIATAELGGSFTASLFAVFLPLLGLAMLMMFFGVLVFLHFRNKRRKAAVVPPPLARA